MHRKNQLKKGNKMNTATIMRLVGASMVGFSILTDPLHLVVALVGVVALATAHLFNAQ